MPSEAFRRYQALRTKLVDRGDFDVVNDVDYLWQAANETIRKLEEAVNQAKGIFPRVHNG